MSMPTSPQLASTSRGPGPGLLLLSLLVSLLACGHPEEEGDEEPAGAVESALAPGGSLKFSVAGKLSQPLFDQIVPTAHQTPPYAWGIWAATDAIGMVNSCFRENNRRKSDYPYPCWDPTAFNGWGGFAEKRCVTWNAIDKCTSTQLVSQLGSNNPGDVLLRAKFRAHKVETIWLVGNEPDNFRQDNLLDPKQYGRMLAVAADQWRTAWGRLGQQAPMVFGQGTYGRGGLKEWNPKYPDVAVGLDYLKAAYAELKALRRDDSKVLRDIHALSVHEYVGRYVPPFVLHWDVELRRKDWSSTKPDLWDTMGSWTRGLNEFRTWSRTVDNGLLANKPLYLTEFGALDAFCPATLWKSQHPNPSTTLGENCPAAAVRGDSNPLNDHVFYGRQNDEGIWGMLAWQLGYLKANEKDWKRAYLYVAQMWKQGGECTQTLWLEGDKLDCTAGRGALSPAGKRYADVVARLGLP